MISGDLVPSESIVEHCNGCDVLVYGAYPVAGYERSLANDQVYLRAFHTSTFELAELANRAGAKTLLVYHHLFFGGSTEEELIEELGERFEGQLISGRDLGVY